MYSIINTPIKCTYLNITVQQSECHMQKLNKTLLQSHDTISAALCERPVIVRSLTKTQKCKTKAYFDLCRLWCEPACVSPSETWEQRSAGGMGAKTPHLSAAAAFACRVESDGTAVGVIVSVSECVFVCVLRCQEREPTSIRIALTER